MISDLKRHAAFGGTALNAVHPYKAFSLLGKFRRLTAVKHADEVVRDQNRVQQLPLRRHRMCGNALNIHPGTAGIEGLPNDFTEFAAVNRVGKIDREL